MRYQRKTPGSVNRIKCPKCESAQSTVLDSRGRPGNSIRRRRICECGFRYSTYEVIGDCPAPASVEIREAVAWLRAGHDAIARATATLAKLGAIAEDDDVVPPIPYDEQGGDDAKRTTGRTFYGPDIGG